MEVKKTDDGRVLSFETVRKPGTPATGSGSTPAPQTVDELKAEVQRLESIIAQRYQMQTAAERDDETVAEIALFIREHYAAEISRGRHSGRSLAEVVTYYLGLERMYSRMPWWKLILRSLTRAE